MAKKPIRATQLSTCGSMALTASRSPFNPKEIWWTLHVKSPKNGGWVEIQGGVRACWMFDLGFNPDSPT